MAGDNPTFIKICGITRLGDARVAVRAGANALGFLFAPSPRRLSVSKASGIARHVHPSVHKFGVFVDAPIDTIIQVVDDVDLDGVQLQGDEDPEFVSEVKSALGERLVSKVVRVRNRKDVEAVASFQADAIFFDRKDPGLPAAASRPIPPSWFANIGQQRFVVAGGLTAANVGRMVKAVRPWGVDVSSGVEISPGKKDHQKMRDFIRAVRKAEAS